MTRLKNAERYFRNSVKADGIPDPVNHPEAYHNVLFARMLADMADMTIIIVFLAMTSIFLGFLTISLTWIDLYILFPVLFFSYFAFTLGGKKAATPGMRWQNLEAWIWNGGRPNPLHAFIHMLLLYTTSIFLSILFLCVPFTNKRRRCLHDFLSGIVILKRI